MPADIKKYAGIAHSITESIKDWLGGDIATLITQIIPGDWDDKLRQEAIVFLTSLAEMLREISTDNEAAGKAAKNAILAKMVKNCRKTDTICTNSWHILQ